MLLEQDGFLNQLTKMYDRSRDKGSVFITVKRYAGCQSRKAKREAAKAELQLGEVAESKVLVRAVAGKSKFSTIVSAKDHQRFSKSMMNITKVKMDNLKKKEKTRPAKSVKA